MNGVKKKFSADSADRASRRGYSHSPAFTQTSIPNENPSYGSNPTDGISHHSLDKPEQPDFTQQQIIALFREFDAQYPILRRKLDNHHSLTPEEVEFLKRVEQAMPRYTQFYLSRLNEFEDLL